MYLPMPLSTNILRACGCRWSCALFFFFFSSFLLLGGGLFVSSGEAGGTGTAFSKMWGWRGGGCGV